jgi:pyruvate,water dikinase
MNVVYAGESLDTHPDRVLRIILELARAGESARRQEPAAASASRAEQRLLDAVGEERREEALEVVRIARLSWRLRDDDNVLIGQLESQLDRAVQIAARRLRRQKRLDASAPVTLQAAATIAEALLDDSGGPVSPAAPPTNGEAGSSPRSSRAGRQPRQMIGQPAAPGLATGRARVVRRSQDLGSFRSGEVLVCDSIQPTMTHLVPLAQAVVERRGGMLIHGAIIARELGIPCVNGVEAVTELLEDGDLVTVDGYLGIVTVGPPEFDLELSRSDPSS